MVESLCSSSSVDGELADGVGHDGQGQRGDVGVEEAVEAAADAVVVERGQLRRGQPEQLGDVPGGPLADAVEGLAGDQEVLEQDQQAGGGGDAGAPVLARAGGRGGTPRGGAAGGSGRGSAGRRRGRRSRSGRRRGRSRRGVWRSGRSSAGRLGVCPTGSSPRRTVSASGSGGRSAATSADMVVRGGGWSRGENPSKILMSICLDVSRAARDLRRGVGRKSWRGEGDRRVGHCLGVGQGEECRTRRRRRRPGEDPAGRAAPTPEKTTRPDLRSAQGKFRDNADEMCGKSVTLV